jgi:golgin subfamily B member 1
LHIFEFLSFLDGLTFAILDEVFDCIEVLTIDTLDFLKDLELKLWVFAVTKQYWTERVKKLIKGKDENKVSLIVYHLLSLQLKCKTSLVLELVNELDKQKNQLTGDLLFHIVQTFTVNDVSLSHKNIQALKQTTVKKWINTFDEGFNILDKSGQRSGQTLLKLISNGSNQNMLNQLNIDNEFAQQLEKFFDQKTKKSSKLITSFDLSDIESWHKDEFNRSSTEKLETLAVIVRGFELITSYPLRYTQILSILLYLKSNEPIFLQIGTGEGKSWLIIAFSIMKVLYGETVDIITSSNLLAIRDATDKKYLKIYDLFDVSIGHNCDDDEETRKAVYATKSIIYGSLGNFQRDYLLQKYYGKNITAGRKHQNVVVDEVDNMCLDKGNCFTDCDRQVIHQKCHLTRQDSV